MRARCPECMQMATYRGASGDRAWFRCNRCVDDFTVSIPAEEWLDAQLRKGPMASARVVEARPFTRHGACATYKVKLQCGHLFEHALLRSDEASFLKQVKAGWILFGCVTCEQAKHQGATP